MTDLYVDSDREESEQDLFPETIDKGDYWVVKRNELIRGQYELSASAQKVLASLLSLLNSQDERPLRKQQMSVTELADLLGVSRQRTYVIVDEVTTELKRMYARLPIIEEEGGQQLVELGESFRKVSFFRECQYLDHKQMVVWEWEERLEPYIRGFKKNFTKYQLRQIRGLNSGYSIRVYEILRSYHSLKNVEGGQLSIIRNINLDEFREMLGIPVGRYTQFSKLKEKVLNVAQRELSDTDLDFTFSAPERSEKRPRAKITYLQFRIASKSPIQRLKTPEGLLMTMTGHFGRRIATELITDFGEERCRLNVIHAYNTAESFHGTDSAIRSMPGFIRHSINLDLASTRGALNPAEYKSKEQKEFIIEELTPIWGDLPEEIREEFIDNRFESDYFKKALNRWSSANGYSEKVSNRELVRQRLRDINDTGW